MRQTLDLLVQKCTTLDLSQRYQNIEEVMAVLDNFDQGSSLPVSLQTPVQESVG